ncbi:hypothetical protein RGU12_04635 [Fredinandcohnia sp. QZ13]|uniref:hypothetical protein n=1 Tax=Fredinandcohnia sp. QZ13 TaxID=3073144 RepID=UPI0028536540|nr:hypothetical protein [Fredinandcohnia sp. QZ13]MDR4886839.1 hypothetical protein [Fredinandcohnia sp. QZ13]
MNKFLAAIGIVFIIFVTGVIEADDVFEYKNAISVSGLSSDEEVTVNSNEDVVDGLIPELEMQFFDTETMNGNKVEIYREYEVYRNEANEVIKKVPTDNYEYLEYWR